MDSECQAEYKDKYYAKKNKTLCAYCSYRQVVPSKNNMFCSEICRLLYLSISEDLDIQDISKLIKLSKIELIQIILNLKCQKFTKQDLDILFEKKENKQHGLIINNNPIKVDFS